MTNTTLSSGRGWLSAAAAASIARIDRALGHAMQITEAGRTWAQQDVFWQAYQRYLNGGPWAAIALDPDAPSIHQLGNAIDSDEAQQHLALMVEHGWIRTVYRGGKLVEPWHFEYRIANDQHRNDPNPEDDMTPDQENKLNAIYAALFGPANLGVKKTTWKKPYGEKSGEAFYGMFDVVIRNQVLLTQLLAERKADDE